LEIGDLPCDRVAKIESFSWEQKVIKSEVGQLREDQKEPALLKIPNLKLTISMEDLDPWRDWFKDYIRDGEINDEAEKSGQLTFLGLDMQEELATISLVHVGIISLEQEAVEANKNAVARFDVELYVEEVSFDYYTTE
jgi:hypothetical protein